MSALSDQLYGIYTANIYPVLAKNDPVCQQSLAKAGLGWNVAGSVPAAHRASFEQEMKMQAWLAATRITDARSLDPGTTRAKLLSGPLTLFRVADSGKHHPGIWWFTEKVASAAGMRPGPIPKPVAGGLSL